MNDYGVTRFVVFQTKQLRHGSSKKCLSINETKDKLLMEECDSQLSRQQWQFENFNATLFTEDNRSRNWKDFLFERKTKKTKKKFTSLIIIMMIFFYWFYLIFVDQNVPFFKSLLYHPAIKSYLIVIIINNFIHITDALWLLLDGQRVRNEQTKRFISLRRIYILSVHTTLFF